MATIWKELTKGVLLTATPANLYQAPLLTFAAVQAVSITNSTGAPISANVYLVPDGQAAGTAYRIAMKTIPAGGCVSVPEAVNHKLEPGASLYGDGDGANITISGTEYVPNT